MQTGSLNKCYISEYVWNAWNADTVLQGTLPGMSNRHSLQVSRGLYPSQLTQSRPHMAPGIVGSVTLIAYNAIAKLNEGSNAGTQQPACTHVWSSHLGHPGLVYRAPHSTPQQRISRS